MQERRWKRSKEDMEKGRIIEEVKEFKYLGYILQKNGGQEAHIKDRVRRAAARMGQIWELGKKIRRGLEKEGMAFRQINLDSAKLWSRGVGLGREREGIEKTEERCMRWLLGVEKRTSWYIVREELQREKLRGS